MRKAINFDIDTKKYKEATSKRPLIAYGEIKRFLKKNGFEHRQGSGYVSKASLNDVKIYAIIQNMSLELKWLKKCVKQIDVTNIGRQHSLIDTINNVPTENELDNIDDFNII